MSVIQSKILLNIYYPGQWILKVNVHESATVTDIMKFIKNSDIELIHNGIQLNSQHTFGFYGLENEDILVVVPKTVFSTFNSRYWEIFSQNEDIYRERITNAIDPMISLESARIRDLQINKIENKPRVFKKLIQLYQEEQAQKQTHKAKTYLPKAVGKPSTDPLPCFWDSSATPFSKPKEIHPIPLSPLKDDEVGVTDN